MKRMFLAKTVLLSIFLFLHVCSLHADNKRNMIEKEVIDSIAKQMHDELNIHGISGGRWGRSEEIDHFSMEFHVARPATIDEARGLTLYILGQIVQTINSYEDIQPYLQERPFPVQKVFVCLHFKRSNGRNYCDGSVASVWVSPQHDDSAAYLRLTYEAEDPWSPYGGRDLPLLEETFEEATRLNNQAPVKNLAVHQSTELELEIDHVLAAFSKKMQDSYDLYWQMGGDLVYGVGEVGGGALAYYRATQEEARTLILQAAEELLSKINNNEKLKPYLPEFPFSSNRLRLKITFQPKRYSSEREGSTGSITLEGDVVKYFMDYSSVGAASESYQEALNRVKNSPLEPVEEVVRKKIVDFGYGFIDCIAELWVGLVWMLFLLYWTVTGGV